VCRRGVLAVDALDLTVNRGEISGLLRPNGAGDPDVGRGAGRRRRRGAPAGDVIA
jgi:ABC-type uncharacterized transport system ATPase subunit